MTIDLDGLELSATAVSGAAARPGTVLNVRASGNVQRFVPTATEANSRFFDAEFKLLNYAANILGPSSEVSGVIRLHTELPVCTSCGSVIDQFRSAYPNIQLIVTTG